MALDTPEEDGRGRRWTFLTNHARLLLTIARNPSARLRDLASAGQIPGMVKASW